MQEAIAEAVDAAPGLPVTEDDRHVLCHGLRSKDRQMRHTWEAGRRKPVETEGETAEIDRCATRALRPVHRL